MPSKDKKSSSKKNDPTVMQPNQQFPGAQFNQFPQYSFPAAGGYPFFGSCQNAMPNYPAFPPQPTQQSFQPQPPPQPQQQQPQFPNQGFYPAYPPYPGYYHH